MLWAAAVRPNHHNNACDNHRDREDLPHADVLYPGAGKLRIRLAEEFNNNTKRAITNQEQTGYRTHRAWFANVQVQNDNFTYTYDSSSKVLKIMVGSETDITNIKSITSSEMIGEETVSNYEVQGYTFSGKITTTMKKK